MVGRWIKPLTALAAAFALCVGSTPLFAQSATGRITGRVTNETGAPLTGARVTVVGTSLITGSDQNGQYTFGAVPVGARDVRVSMLGYAQQKRLVTVTAGETVEASFRMAFGAVQLEGIVTTATGDQRKVEIGNNIAQINVATRTETAPIANMSDLMNSVAPGVQVLQSPLTGGGQRIRIRGTNSLSLNNEPIFVIDGVRMTSDNNSSSIGIGGTNPSRLSDLNPEEIESMEIVKGPSAATLYGTDAANGVVVITTRRGRAGAPQWRTYAEGGLIKDRNEYPTAYRGWRSGTSVSTPTNTVQCLLFQVAAGTCVQDSVSTFNLFADPESSPNDIGYRQQYGLQVSGGVQDVRYFVSGEWEAEVGQLKMPGFAVDTIRRRRGADPLFEQLRPNALAKTSVRANINANPTTKMDVAISTGFISSSQRLPQTDNNTTGLLSNGFGGPGNKTNGLMGYRAFTPDGFFSETVQQDVNRFIGSANSNYRPLSWLTLRGIAGIDFASRVDTDLCRRDQCTAFGTSLTGFKQDNRSVFFRYTGDLTGTGTFRPRPTLESRTTAGVQWVKSLFDRNGAYGENLPPGTTQLDAGAIQLVSEVTDESKTLGYFLEEQLSWRDRLFVTGAVRMDDNSAFGKDFDAVIYPKLSASWLASDESFFPQANWLSSFRLRAAVGASGTQPGPTDAIPFYASGTTTADAIDVPVVVFSAIGNPDLKPERATEMEGGFDASFMRDRFGLELTYYSKLTQDALVARRLPPSVGASVDRFENIGSVKNAGLEYTVTAKPIDGTSFGIDLQLNGSVNANKLVSLGAGIPPIVGATRQQRPGYPLDGFWQRALTAYSDADGDGIIELNEITVTDTNVFIGSDKPTREMSLSIGTELLQRKLRLSALVDHKGGHYLLNGTERIRCESRNNCEGLVSPNASDFLQARTVAVRLHSSRTQAGYMEKADFTRLRELSVNYDLPSRVVSRLRARTATFTVAARNIAVWTNYTGLDPESNYFGGALGTVSDFQTAPPPSYLTFRLNLGL